MDACAKGAASFFVACSSNPERTLKIPAAMRAKRYVDTKAIDQALQMQVSWEVEKLNGASATLSAAAAMVALTLTDRTRALAFILPEDVNSTWPLDSLATEKDAQEEPPAPNQAPEWAQE